MKNAFTELTLYLEVAVQQNNEKLETDTSFPVTVGLAQFVVFVFTLRYAVENTITWCTSPFLPSLTSGTP